MSFPNSTTRTHGLCLRPDQTHGQNPYMSRLNRQVYDQTKSADLSDIRADPIGLCRRPGRRPETRTLVWSGRVGSGPVWFGPCPCPSSGIWALGYIRTQCATHTVTATSITCVTYNAFTHHYYVHLQMKLIYFYMLFSRRILIVAADL